MLSVKRRSPSSEGMEFDFSVFLEPRQFPFRMKCRVDCSGRRVLATTDDLRMEVASAPSTNRGSTELNAAHPEFDLIRGRALVLYITEEIPR